MPSTLPFLLLALAVGAMEGAQVALDDPLLRWIGRWDAEGGERVSLWSASTLAFAMTGERCAIELGAAPSSYRAVIDGAVTAFDQRSGRVDLAPDGLPGKGPHQVRVVAACGSTLRLRGIDLGPGGRLVERTPRPVVLFIGDSITYGASASDTTVGSWPWLASEAIGADSYRVAQGGIGLCDGYKAPLGTRGMEKQFSMKGPFGSAAGAQPYDGEERPSLIVIHLGTNDGNRNEDRPVPMAVFSERYAGFLRAVRARFPAAPILAFELFNSYASDKNTAIADAVSAVDDPGIHLIPTKGWVNPDPTGGDIAADWSHPTDQGHRKLAERAAAAIAPHLR